MITPEQLASSGTEHGHQAALFCYFQINKDKYPLTKWLFASANGFFSTSGQKGKEKAAGLKNGVPDICLPVAIQKTIPRTSFADKTVWTDYYHGLYIELKIPKRQTEKNGGVADNQNEWLTFLSSQSYAVAICYGWEQARDCIIKYLEG
jgi:hypothetical protein